MLPILQDVSSETYVVKDWEKAFLTHYSHTRSIRFACERAGICRPTIEEYHAKYEAFRDKMHEAEKDHFDILYENLCKHANKSPIVALELAKAQVSWLAPKLPPKQVVEVSVKMEPNDVLARWNDSLGIAN